jgi:hypothetical protein
VIFIYSTARSGSTWLGKIFDSHPDVFYLHEPDINDRGLDLFPSYWFANEPSACDLEKARMYIDRLADNRSLRATGTRPVFDKNYRGSAAQIARTAIIYVGKAWERAGMVQRSSRIRVPDLCRHGQNKVLVIKSVSTLGLAEAFVRASGSGLCPILLVRHPCGYVNSMLRGWQHGFLELPDSPGRLLNTRSAVRLGATTASLAGARKVELLAWTWLLQNAEAYSAIAQTGITIKYDEFARQPIEQAKALFGKLGLSWAPQTEAYLDGSSSRDGRYYSTHRQPLAAAGRWRQELDDDAIAAVQRIVTKDSLGQSFFADESDRLLAQGQSQADATADDAHGRCSAGSKAQDQQTRARL